jgi:hypothetical protein
MEKMGTPTTPSRMTSEKAYTESIRVMYYSKHTGETEKISPQRRTTKSFLGLLGGWQVP